MRGANTTRYVKGITLVVRRALNNLGIVGCQNSEWVAVRVESVNKRYLLDL